MDLRPTEILLLLMMVVFFFWLALVEWRLARQAQMQRMLFTSQRGVDLEQSLRDFISRLDRTESQLQNVTARTAGIEAKQPLSVQHVGIVRFNPFSDRGGDQSFVVALLDDRADGVLLSGLHARTESRLYAKPVVGGQSTYPLTGEEKEAIDRALGKSQRLSKRPVPPATGNGVAATPES